VRVSEAICPLSANPEYALAGGSPRCCSEWRQFRHSEVEGEESTIWEMDGWEAWAVLQCMGGLSSPLGHPHKVNHSDKDKPEQAPFLSDSAEALCPNPPRPDLKPRQKRVDPTAQPSAVHG
jgi:hypothetical protein